MKNYGLYYLKKADTEGFTSNFGIKIRKVINPFLRKILKLATKGKIYIDEYPLLDKNKSYIFVSTHSFVEEVPALLATIDRSAWTLFGATNQLEYNTRVYANWLTGIIYVDRYNSDSRKDAIPKMERILNSGSSILIFPEGGWNNTENLLVQRLFASPYYLSKSTNLEVVPIAPFQEFGSEEIYMNVGKPIRLFEFDDKDRAMDYLRDVLGTMVYENIENHAPRVKRRELGYDPRRDFMEERRLEYLNIKWTKDVWDEELTQYFNASEREYNSLQKSIDNMVISSKNTDILVPIIRRRAKENRYDFKEYMHQNWNRK